MNISMRLLKDEIGIDPLCTSVHSSVENDMVSSLFAFESLELSKPGICYCATTEQLAEQIRHSSREGALPDNVLPKRLSLVCVGEPPAAFLKSVHCDVVWTTSHVSLASCLNRAAAVFTYYQEWQEALARVIRMHGSVDDLFKASVDVIKNDLWLVDKYDRILAHHVYRNVRLDKNQLDEVRVGECMPERMRLDGQEERRQGYDFVTPTPKFWRMKAHDSVIAHCPVHVLGDYRLAVVIESNWREVGERDYCLITLLAEYVRSVYASEDIFVHPEYEVGPNLLLRELLDGNSVDRRRMARSLAPFGWDSEHDECACVCIDYPDIVQGLPATAEPEPRLAICDRLRKSFICRTFLYKKKVFTIVNLSRSLISFTDFVRRLDAMVSCGLLCGVSDIFVDVLDVRGRYLQAQKALESFSAVGRKGTASFNDAVVDIVVDQVVTMFPAKYFVSKEIGDLIRYDAERDSHLWETLKVYLATNCNIAKTCRELYLQRGGALYRLDKIQAMLPSYDLGDADDRLQLMLRAKIVDRYLLNGEPGV
ncbi:MAG: PucR family transcriptional regulator [Coriobacteriia bacterium]